MATYNLNSVKVGLKILVDRDPCVIVGTDVVKPGKGQAFTKVKYKNLKTGRVNERTIKASESFDAIGDMQQWMKEEDLCLVTLWEGNPIVVTPPNFVYLEITETDPGVKGDTSGGGNKPATLETGAVVRVPLFIQIGEKIKVDTRTGEYVSRA